jgi:hypothetical protein
MENVWDGEAADLRCYSGLEILDQPFVFRQESGEWRVEACTRAEGP